jgi:pimeloyl-ACP methyl ester carboxylesterase
MGLTAVILASCAAVRRPDLVEMLVMISGAYHPGQSRPATHRRRAASGTSGRSLRGKCRLTVRSISRSSWPRSLAWLSSMPTRRAAPVVLDLECGSAVGDGEQDGGVF